MRICDLREDQIHVGLRLISMTGRRGSVVSKDVAGVDDYWWVQWDGDETPMSGFFTNDCECQVIEFINFTVNDLNAAFKARQAFDPEAANKFLEETRRLIEKYSKVE